MPRVHLENPVQRGVKARVLTISAPVIGCLTSLDLAGGFSRHGYLARHFTRVRPICRVYVELDPA